MDTVKDWYVYAVPPRDFFYDCTVTALDYIGSVMDLNPDQWSAQDDRIADLRSAVRAVMSHPQFESDGLHSARVIYDPVRDDQYYLFKVSNNGTTFLVSHYPLISDGAGCDGWDDEPLRVSG